MISAVLFDCLVDDVCDSGGWCQGNVPAMRGPPPTKSQAFFACSLWRNLGRNGPYGVAYLMNHRVRRSPPGGGACAQPFSDGPPAATDAQHAFCRHTV